MPTSYVIQRYGYHPGWVALTFDDGPDGRWTPKILDILKAKHATATFFVIGENMQGRPDLVQREVREGDVVGNHTWTHPNIGKMPPAQTDLRAQHHPASVRSADRPLDAARSVRPIFGDAEPIDAQRSRRRRCSPRTSAT